MLPVNANIGNISYVLCAAVGGLLALNGYATRILSAFSMLNILWDIISFVVPGIFFSKASLIFASVAVSTALVESSRISILGCFKSARAMHSRCRWPPDTLLPPCSIHVSYLSGSRSIFPDKCLHDTDTGNIFLHTGI